MSKLDSFSNNRILRIMVIIGVVIAIFFIGFFVYEQVINTGKVRVSISAVPNDIAITLDSKPIGAGTHYLSSGVHEFNATKDGYRPYQKRIFIDGSQKEASIAISLIPSSAEAKAESERNQEAYQQNEGIAGKQAQEDGLAFRNRNPIVSKLPLKTLLYTIGYRADTSDPTGQSIIIEIDAREGSRAEVVSQISRWGYDPTTMNIQFRNYRNPFDAN